MSTVLRVRHNVMKVTSLNSFAQITGSVNNGCKDVQFVRVLGADSDYMNGIKAMDRLLGTGAVNGRGFYERVCELPKLVRHEDITYYSEQFNKWIAGGKQEITIKTSACSNEIFRRTLSEALKRTEQLYVESEKNSTDSMVRNFLIKELFWADVLLGEGYQWSEQMNSKIVVSNVLKKQEYLFWYMITLLGNDVLLLQYEKDIELDKEWKELSEACTTGAFCSMEIPPYIKAAIATNQNKLSWDKVVKTSPGRKTATEAAVRETATRETAARDVTSSEATTATSSKVQVVIPRRERKRGTESSQTLERNPQTPPPNQMGVRREKTYEELAQMASSVVLIAVHDSRGKVLGTGSGIMIGRNGYILTNNHVACGGQFYSVKIEDDDNVYETDEVIKYNSVLDLAVIRIQRQLNPLPIYKGPQKLVRGQRVVAIGSPLGLFNSVSDGIISGFRVIDDVDMIQFTAPISHGSSGGAVLNMYGEVIGISTAGFDAGQNINLAMGYECINTFVKGFV